MILKSPIDAVAFIDGKVDFYRRNSLGDIDESTKMTYYFNEQGFSYKRLMDARMEQQEFERIIRIPCRCEISEGTIAVIDSKKYVVMNCKKVVQTSPVCYSVVLGNWDNAITEVI